MKRSAILSAIGFALVAGAAQAQPEVEWQRTFFADDTVWATPTSMVQTEDGGFVFAGHFFFFDFLMKLNTEGDSVWCRARYPFGLTRSITRSPDGGFFLAGDHYFMPFPIFLTKTDSDGDSLWSRTYSTGDTFCDCSSMIRLNDGGLALAGTTARSWGEGSESDIWLLRLDDAGNQIWQRHFDIADGDGADYDDCSSLIQTADGGFVLLGTTSSANLENRVSWILKTNDGGKVLWKSFYDTGNRFDYLYSVVECPGGGLALAGTKYSDRQSEYDYWLVKTNANGDTVWTRTYNGGDYSFDELRTLLITADGGFLMTGTVIGPGLGLLRVNDVGEIVWDMEVNWDEGNIDKVPISTISTTDGGYAITGFTFDNDRFTWSIFLLKTFPDPVSAPESDFILHPSAFILHTPFPNPFNSVSVASYELRVASRVNLALYDTGGRLVKTLANGWQTAGEHRVLVNAPSLASGDYLLVLTDGRGQGQARKVVLAK